MLFALLRWNSNVVYIWKAFMANDKEFRLGGLTLSPITKILPNSTEISQLFFSVVILTITSSLASLFLHKSFFGFQQQQVNPYTDGNQHIFRDWNACRKESRSHFEPIEFSLDALFFATRIQVLPLDSHYHSNKGYQKMFHIPFQLSESFVQRNCKTIYHRKFQSELKSGFKNRFFVDLESRGFWHELPHTNLLSTDCVNVLHLLGWKWYFSICIKQCSGNAMPIDRLSKHTINFWALGQ